MNFLLINNVCFSRKITRFLNKKFIHQKIWVNKDKNKELVLSKAKEYYKNNRDRISKQVKERYNLPEEKKIEKRNYGNNRYHTATKDGKNKIRDYARNQYHNLPEEKKNEKREYGRNGYRNMTEEQKNKKREYARNRYHTMIKVC